MFGESGSQSAKIEVLYLTLLRKDLIVKDKLTVNKELLAF
jgi:hypothetical protein